MFPPSSTTSKLRYVTSPGPSGTVVWQAWLASPGNDTTPPPNTPKRVATSEAQVRRVLASANDFDLDRRPDILQFNGYVEFGPLVTYFCDFNINSGGLASIMWSMLSDTPQFIIDTTCANFKAEDIKNNIQRLKDLGVMPDNLMSLLNVEGEVESLKEKASQLGRQSRLEHGFPVNLANYKQTDVDSKAFATLKLTMEEFAPNLRDVDNEDILPVLFSCHVLRKRSCPLESDTLGDIIPTIDAFVYTCIQNVSDPHKRTILHYNMYDNHHEINVKPCQDDIDELRKVVIRRFKLQLNNQFELQKEGKVNLGYFTELAELYTIWLHPNDNKPLATVVFHTTGTNRLTFNEILVSQEYFSSVLRDIDTATVSIKSPFVCISAHVMCTGLRHPGFWPQQGLADLSIDAGDLAVRKYLVKDDNQENRMLHFNPHMPYDTFTDLILHGTLVVAPHKAVDFLDERATELIQTAIEAEEVVQDAASAMAEAEADLVSSQQWIQTKEGQWKRSGAWNYANEKIQNAKDHHDNVVAKLSEKIELADKARENAIKAKQILTEWRKDKETVVIGITISKQLSAQDVKQITDFMCHCCKLNLQNENDIQYRFVIAAKSLKNVDWVDYDLNAVVID